MATEITWRRKGKDHGSPVSALICLPMSSSRDSASGPNTLEVSAAKGMKWWLALRWAYFSVFTALLGLPPRQPSWQQGPDGKEHRYPGKLRPIPGPAHTSKASQLPHLASSHPHTRCPRAPGVKVLRLMPVPPDQLVDCCVP